MAFKDHYYITTYITTYITSLPTLHYITTYITMATENVSRAYRVVNARLDSPVYVKDTQWIDPKPQNTTFDFVLEETEEVVWKEKLKCVYVGSFIGNVYNRIIPFY